VNKKDFSEADIRSKFITPAIIGDVVPKWDLMTQVREEGRSHLVVSGTFGRGRSVCDWKAMQWVTTETNELLASFHDRMPLIIAPRD
jgi:type I restriction enzyme, R subunit